MLCIKVFVDFLLSNPFFIQQIRWAWSLTWPFRVWQRIVEYILPAIGGRGQDWGAMWWGEVPGSAHWPAGRGSKTRWAHTQMAHRCRNCCHHLITWASTLLSYILTLSSVFPTMLVSRGVNILLKVMVCFLSVCHHDFWGNIIRWYMRGWGRRSTIKT